MKQQIWNRRENNAQGVNIGLVKSKVFLDEILV